jgi:hypothetical protein
MATRSHAAIQLNTPHPCQLSVRTDIARAHFGMSLNDSLLRRAGSKPRSLARPSQSRIAMLSFGSPPLKEGSQDQIAAAFFSFVSYFDQTRQSRGKIILYYAGPKSACCYLSCRLWAGLFSRPEACQQDGNVAKLPLNNWQPVPSVGTQYQSRQLTLAVDSSEHLSEKGQLQFF